MSVSLPGVSLNNTLNGLDTQSQADALEQALQAELARRTQEAAAAAAQAGQQYQQAAAAPPPDISPMQAFIPSLLGNIASVIGRDPRYAEQAREDIRQQKAALLQSRAQNLQALRENAAQRADAAQRAGDFENEAKARIQMERLSKVHQQILDTQQNEQQRQMELLRQQGRATETAEEHRDRLAEIAASGAQQRQTIASKPTTTTSERAALVRQGINPDNGLMTSAFGNREVSRRLALAKRGDEKSRTEAWAGALDIAVQRWDSDKTPRAMGTRLLGLRGPFDKPEAKSATYALTGERIYKKVKGQWIIDVDAQNRAKARANELVTPWFQQ